MGLGAADALSTPSPVTKSTVVIGIYCVAEAKALIDSGASPFRASVTQDTHQLALSVVDQLVKMHHGRKTPKRKMLDSTVYESSR